MYDESYDPPEIRITITMDDGTVASTMVAVHTWFNIEATFPKTQTVVDVFSYRIIEPCRVDKFTWNESWDKTIVDYGL